MKRSRSPTILDSIRNLGRATNEDILSAAASFPVELSDKVVQELSQLRIPARKLAALRVRDEVAREVQRLRESLKPDPEVQTSKYDLFKNLHDTEPELFWKIVRDPKPCLHHQVLSCASWLREGTVTELGKMQQRTPWMAILRGAPAMRMRWASRLELSSDSSFAKDPNSWRFLMPQGSYRQPDILSLSDKCLEESLSPWALRDLYVGDDLTRYEAAALIFYTYCVDSFADAPNRALRRASGPEDGVLWFWLPFLFLMFSALYKISLRSPHENIRWSPGRDMSLWRAVLFTDLRDFGYHAGGIVRCTAFTSTSSDRRAAENFERSREDGGGGSSISQPGDHLHTFCQIDDVTSAVDVVRYSDAGSPNMQEVIVLPGTRLLVLAVYEQPYGVFMHLREVP